MSAVISPFRHVRHLREEVHEFGLELVGAGFTPLHDALDGVPGVLLGQRDAAEQVVDAVLEDVHAHEFLLLGDTHPDRLVDQLLIRRSTDVIQRYVGVSDRRVVDGFPTRLC